MKPKVRWAKKPTEKDYAAAQRYLSLVVGPEKATSLTRALRKATVDREVARDLMRAAHHPPSAPQDNKQRKEIEKGKMLPPVLIVRDVQRRTLIIADGYHRLGAVSELDPECEVPCKVVSIRL
jgi:hypothetical protein